MSSSNKVRIIATKVTASLVIPAIPVGVWYYNAVQDRQAKAEEVRSKVRVPNVQTIDDLMIEKCQPGDVVLFDRRCYKCASGPTAAFSCILSKTFLCDDNDSTTNSNSLWKNITRTKQKHNSKIIDIGQFEHVGIIVPATSTKIKSRKYDPTDLLLLEATSSDGVVARPLLSRLEMSQSRTVLLLPLASPGERRYDDSYEPMEKTKKVQEHLKESLSKFKDTWVEESKKQNYGDAHSTLGILGALGYATGLYKHSPGPVSPSAFLVMNALQESGVAMNLKQRTAYETKVEDFLRDYRFIDDSSSDGETAVRLRPGWRFLPPVVMRENSRS